MFDFSRVARLPDDVCCTSGGPGGGADVPDKDAPINGILKVRTGRYVVVEISRHLLKKRRDDIDRVSDDTVPPHAGMAQEDLHFDADISRRPAGVGSSMTTGSGGIGRSFSRGLSELDLRDLSGRGIAQPAEPWRASGLLGNISGRRHLAEYLRACLPCGSGNKIVQSRLRSAKPDPGRATGRTTG